jgi:molybdopterin-guanine dinucleotide biosynthesis protein B
MERILKELFEDFCNTTGVCLMTVVVSIVGRSGSGKTTFIERLVPLLKSRGLKVGVIKHAAKGFQIDREGKDSHRIFLSGADVAILSKEKFAFIKRVERDDLRVFLKYFEDYDVVLTEGFSGEDFPKIIITTREKEPEKLVVESEKDIKSSAVLAEINVSNSNLEEDVERIAEKIIELSLLEGCK